MKRVYSSLNDFSDFIKDSEIKSKGHLTIKYGRKFALAVF